MLRIAKSIIVLSCRFVDVRFEFEAKMSEDRILQELISLRRIMQKIQEANDLLSEENSMLREEIDILKAFKDKFGPDLNEQNATISDLKEDNAILLKMRFEKKK